MSPEQNTRKKLPWESKVGSRRPSRPMPDEILEREQKERAQVRKKFNAIRNANGTALLDKALGVDTKQAYTNAKKLANELQIMRALEPKTIDGEYSCKFSAWESPIAAGPMGATSGGLRPLGPLEYWNILAKGSDDTRTKNLQVKLNEAIGAAKDIKLIVPDGKSGFLQKTSGSVQKIQADAIHQITAETSQVEKDEKLRLRQELTEQRSMARQINEFLKAQKARNPLKDRRKFEDTIPPNHGPGMGGWGAM